MWAYLVCATPRSGSTLLCELLKDTGVAGRPEEYFEARSDTGVPPHPGDYIQGLPPTGAGIRADPTPPRAPTHSSLVGLRSYGEHLERTFGLGTTENGVFGAKIMWQHLPDLQALATQLPDCAGLELRDLLTRLFRGPRYVWVTREDKVRQAVSLWRALQTRSWRTDEGARQPPELKYSFEAIDYLVHSLTADDVGWRGFFDSNGISPLRVVYEEDLARDRDATVRMVLRHIGVAPPKDWRAEELLQRQADALSEDWVASYHREVTERSAGIGAGALAGR